MKPEWGIHDTSHDFIESRLLVVPFPPSIGQYYRSNQGRRVMSKRGREFREQMVSLLLKGQHPLDWPWRLSVELRLYPPDRRRRDIDNFQKPMLDALTHARIWVDDSQVDRLLTTREAVNKPGFCEVSVEVFEYAGE